MWYKFRMKRGAYFFSKSLAYLFHFFLKIKRLFLSSKRARILVYHRTCYLPREGSIEYFNVSPKNLALQMQFLKDRGYAIVSLDNLIDHIRSKKKFSPKTVCLTFDDGFQNNYTYAFPELKSRNLIASFYIVCNYMGTDQPFEWIKKDEALKSAESNSSEVWRPLSWDQIHEMQQSGMEFGSHSLTHPDFNILKEENWEQELVDSKQKIESNINSSVQSFVCPFGVEGDIARRLKLKLKSAGYSGACLGRMGGVTLNTDPYDLPRLSIYEGDSLKVFEQKVDGAYDWMEWLQPLWRIIR